MWARLGPPRVRIVLVIGSVFLCLSLGVYLYELLLFTQVLPVPTFLNSVIVIFLVIPGLALGVLVLLAGISLWLSNRGPPFLFIAFLLVEVAGITLSLLQTLYPFYYRPIYSPGTYYLLGVFEVMGGACNVLGMFLLLLLALRVPPAVPMGPSLPPSSESPPPSS